MQIMVLNEQPKSCKLTDNPIILEFSLKLQPYTSIVLFCSKVGSEGHTLWNMYHSGLDENPQKILYSAS